MDRIGRGHRLGATPDPLELVAQVAEALAAAHSVGVLQKDIKPSNVLIARQPDGTPKARLTDFGIGLVKDRGVLAGRGFTVTGFTELAATSSSGHSGTRLYMAPELLHPSLDWARLQARRAVLVERLAEATRKTTGKEPNQISAPLAIGSVPLTRRPPRNVPFLLPRSSSSAFLPRT